MVFIYFIGHLQATAREYWLQDHGGGWLAKAFLALVALVFPDLQLFNLVDDVVAGTAIPMALFTQTALPRLRLHLDLSFLCLGRLSGKGIMIRRAIIFSLLLVFGAVRLPLETALTEQHRRASFPQTGLGLDLREQIGQLGFLAALSGFRSLVADVVFIQAHVAWERTEWGRVLLLFREATTLQPRSILFWDMAAWHMAWNASVAALHDPFQPNDALRAQGAARIFRPREGFPRTRDQEQPRPSATLRIARPAL